MAYINFQAARRTYGVRYAATVACMYGVSIEKTFEWLRQSSKIAV
jgi:hypothetical protein